ncbi:MAG: hypothetical protein PWP28_2378 [Oceanotoga sp.]|jgi:hypothetical protein|uniref:hypothetical protein n=1 Tax=Oceanotoga sp. TaxID=2108366 RepID=UPI0026551827|nr:hypothetical protein [Oceanotoga sp.]MDN5343498.1 hypothetical protein [Oceanotoga sp.]
MRGISNNFIKNLKDGILKPILEYIKEDSNLILEIRNDYINIYYRGGNLLKISEKTIGISKYDFYFNNKYILNPNKTNVKITNNMKVIDSTNPKDVEKWIDIIPHIKYEMDKWLSKYKKLEKEYQQTIVRENNIDLAKSTDYFICDIENAKGKGRYDLIAVKWISNGAKRKSGKNLRLAFVELKFGDGSLKGSSGLEKHIKDVDEFLSNQKNIDNIKEEMKKTFNQKLELCLIENQNKIENFSDEKPEYILVLANHDPDSTLLRIELKKIQPSENFELKIATSNFMGYGLFQEAIYTLDEFKKKFCEQI